MSVERNCVIPIQTHYEPVPFDGRLATLLATGRFYFGPTTYADTFVWSFPANAADRAAGRICSATGYWAAGKDIVYVDGRPFINEFAPTHED